MIRKPIFAALIDFLIKMLMKKLLLVLVCISAIFSACLKSSEGCKPKSMQSEEGAITTYASANGITATRHTSGLYYQIINQGSGVTPTINSRIFVTYTGKLLDGTVF